VILAEAGKDATEAFEDVGHSDEARGLLTDMFVGDFEGGSVLSSAKSSVSTGAKNAQAAATQSGSSFSYILPLALLGGYFAWRFYSSDSA